MKSRTVTWRLDPTSTRPSWSSRRSASRTGVRELSRLSASSALVEDAARRRISAEDPLAKAHIDGVRKLFHPIPVWSHACDAAGRPRHTPFDYEWNCGVNFAMLALVPRPPIGLVAFELTYRPDLPFPFTALISAWTTISASVMGW